jgi:antitoxin ParD1/3/4
MSISIAPELEEFVRAKIASGKYLSANELFREAFGLLAERDEVQRRRIEAMNEFIQVGIDEFERGEFCDPDEVWKELDEIILAAEKNRKNA